LPALRQWRVFSYIADNWQRAQAPEGMEQAGPFHSIGGQD
jgi:hypothetical protein